MAKTYSLEEVLAEPVTYSLEEVLAPPSPAPPAPRRGGTRAEARPYVAGDARVVAPVAPPALTPGQLLEQPAPEDQRPKGLTPDEILTGTVAPWRLEQARVQANYGDTSRSPEFKAGQASKSERRGRAVELATGNQRLGALARGATDIAALAPEALLTTTKIGVDIANLATLGMAQPVSDWFGETIKAVQNDKSNRFQEKRQAFGKLLKDPNAGVLDVAGFLAANPEYAVEIAAPSVPAVLIGTAGARVGAMLLGGESGALAGAGAANALMNAGSTFSDTQAGLGGKLAAAGAAGAGTALLGRLGGAEAALATGVRGGALRAAATVAPKEAAQEFGESMSQSLGQGTVEDNFNLAEAAKQATAEGLAGGLIGGGVGALSAAGRAQAPSAPLPTAEQIARDRGFLVRQPVTEAPPPPPPARPIQLEDMPTTVMPPEQLAAVTPPAVGTPIGPIGVETVPQGALARAAEARLAGATNNALVPDLAGSAGILDAARDGGGADVDGGSGALGRGPDERRAGGDVGTQPADTAGVPAQPLADGRGGDDTAVDEPRFSRAPITVGREGSVYVARAGKRVVGRAAPWVDAEGRLTMQDVAVSAPFRKRGVATALYQQVEADTGKQLQPAASTSDDAFEFWKRYRPEAVSSDLRHRRDELIGQPVLVKGRPATIVAVGARGATAQYDGAEGVNSQTTINAAKVDAALVAPPAAAATPAAAIDEPQVFNDLADPEKQSRLVNIAIDRAIAREQGSEPAPLRRVVIGSQLKTLLTGIETGKMDVPAIAGRISSLAETLELKALDRKFSPKPRERGADYVRQRLREAKRRGDIDEEASNFAEWFAQRNEALLDDVGISVRSPKGERGVSGNYDPVRRVVTLMKGSENTTTAVHEVLHHFERMMPAATQDRVRAAWLRDVSAELRKAGKAGDKPMQEYLGLVLEANVGEGNTRATAEKASNLLKDGKVPYSAYALFNPSEYWAVNMTRTAQARFKAKDSIWARSRQWLSEALEHTKGALGLRSDAPMLKALNAVLKSEGKFASKDMLGTKATAFDSRRPFAQEADPESRTEVSTTVPSSAQSKKAGAPTVADAFKQNWVIDASDIKASKTHTEAVTKAISAYNAVRGEDGPDAAEALIRTVVDNLLWLHDKMPSVVRERAKLWYNGANRIATGWAAEFKLDARRVAGVLAVLSPQKDWFMNVTLAERVLRIFTNHSNEVWTPAMSAWVDSYINASPTVNEREKRAELRGIASKAEGKFTLADMDGREAAIFLRVFDETYFPRQYRLVTPEGGFGDLVTNSDPDLVDPDADPAEPGSVAWGAYDTIGKALRVLRAPDSKIASTVSAEMGKEHKVRNFYNNIIAPNSAEGHVTIDTHAIAAAFVKALSGASTEVMHNFGGIGSNRLTGASGSYGLFAEAYRRAAAERGILPREMQSITWEAIRSIFEPSFKSKRVGEVEKIWDRYKSGGIDRATAREEAYQLGGGIKKLPWEGTPEGAFVDEGGRSFDSEIAADPANRRERVLDPVVAKDSITVGLAAATSKIPGLARLLELAGLGNAKAHELLQDAAVDSLKHLLAGTSAKLKISRSTGLYGGYVEPSLGIRITYDADADQSAVLAALAKFAENFKQSEIHVRQGTASKAGTAFPDGSYATPVYRWDLKQALDRATIESVIKAPKLKGLTFGDDFVEAYYTGDPHDNAKQDAFDAAIKRADRLLGASSEGLKQSVARLWAYGNGRGRIPFGRVRGDISAGPAVRSETARRVAEFLTGEKIRPAKSAATITEKQRKLQERIRDAYDSLPANDLANPLVRRAYEALNRALVEQYQALPIQVQLTRGKKAPYENSEAMRRDVLDNNRLKVQATEPGTFGGKDDAFDKDHPLLQDSGLKDSAGKPMLYNDLLRGVHDYFAHTLSEAEFGPKGEEAAWRNHMAATLDPLARWALTVETRAQNSWVNFRPGAMLKPLADRGFAPQKAALIPAEFALTGDTKVDAPMKEFIDKLIADERQGSKPVTKPAFSRSVPTVETHNKWAGYVEKSTKFGDAYVRWVEDDTTASVIDIQAPGKTRGRAALAQLAQLTGKELYAVGVVDDSQAFWDRMEEDGVITGQTDENFVDYFGMRFSRTAITRTPEFKKWFGDWEAPKDAWASRSKVINEDGSPKIMYHGTFGDFSQFKKRTGDIGMHFGTAEAASDRVTYVPHRKNKDGTETSANVMPVYLNIRNPLRLPDVGFWNADNMDRVLLEAYPNDGARIRRLKSTKDIREFIQSKGHDGVVYRNTGEVAGAEPFRERIRETKEAMHKVFPKGKNSYDLEDQKVPEYIAWSEAEAAYSAHREASQEDSYIAFEPTQIKSATGNDGGFSSKNPDIRFRRGGATGMPVADIQATVDRMTAGWANAPEIVVATSMADERIPKAVREYDAKQRSQGAAGDVEGFIFGGTVYVMADQIATDKDVVRVVAHEALGHFGMRGHFGPEFDSMLAELAVVNEGKVRAKARQYGLDYSKRAERLQAAEEVLAELAQTTPKNNFVQRAIAAIRGWLRKAGLDLEFSDVELVSTFIEPARGFVERGRGTLAPNDQPAASRTDAFKAWFGDSKVVDAKGKPLVVYHGSTNDFSVFDRSKSDIESDMGAGFYFSDNPADVANNYANQKGPDLTNRIERLAGYIEQQDDIEHAAAVEEAKRRLTQGAPNTLPVFLSIQNPVVFGTKAETYFDLEETYIEETDEYGEATGKLVDFVDALRDEALDSRWYGFDADAVVADIFEAAVDGGLKASDLVKVIKESDGAMDAQDAESDTGGVATTEIIRRAFATIGFDGVIDHTPFSKWPGMKGLRATTKHFIAFEPTQIKSATGNTGAFDPANPDIRFSRRATGPHSLRKFGKADQTIEAIQDRYTRWKQAIEDVRKQGGSATEANDFYRAEERYWGKVGARVEDFDKEVSDFIAEVQKDGLSLREVQTWAYAKHATERNAYIAAKRDNGQGFEAWSGMSDEDAQAFIDDATNAGQDAALEKHRLTLQRWIQQTRDIMRDEGLITDEEHTTLSQMFKDYMPLRGLKDDDGKEVKPAAQGKGKGFDIRGKETKRALGRYSEADHVIENILADRTRTLIRAGKNEVLRTFLQFVIDNPSDNLWKVEAVERKAAMTIDAQGNQVIEEVDKPIHDDRTVSIKDGGRQVYVEIKDVALREAMKNLNVEDVGYFTGHLLAANRMLSRLYTSLSPTFTVINAARDAMTATFGMIDELGFKATARMWAKVPMAAKASFRAEWSKYSPEYQEYRQTGGKTGFFDFKDIDTLSKDLQARIAHAERFKLDPRALGSHALKHIERINGGIENTMRFAAYVAAREAGETPARAASISKNLTVNFNRKGTMTPKLASWFLFFNPAVQGTTRIAQALKSPKVLAVLGGAMVGVAMLALRNADMGEDDDGVAWWDKIPAEVKDRNLIWVLPPTSEGGEAIPGSKTGRYYKFPLPYGYNFFATVANQAVDIVRNARDPARGRTPIEAAAKAATSFIGAYMPVSELGKAVEGSPESAVLAAVPDVLNPFAQVALNINRFGKNIYPSAEFDKTTPDSKKYFPGQAGTIFQKAAEGLSTVTGGTEHMGGAIEVAPGTIETLVRAYGGGPTAFGLDLANAIYARQSIKRDNVDLRRLPFAKQFYGQIDEETDRMIGYERMGKIEESAAPYKKARKAGAHEEADAIAKDSPLAELGQELRDTRKALSDLRKEELEVLSAKDEPDSARLKRISEINAEKRRVLQDINRAYDEALRMKATAQ